MEVLTPLTPQEEANFVRLMQQVIDAPTRKLNHATIKHKKDYPGCVAIGPKSKKEKMESCTAVPVVEYLKLDALKALLERARRANGEMTLSTCIHAFIGLEVSAYAFYNSYIDTESLMLYSLTGVPRFVFLETLLLDSCFIIEVMCRYVSTSRTIDLENPLSEPRIILGARKDLILYNNQLPFFVLQELFSLAYPFIEAAQVADVPNVDLPDHFTYGGRTYSLLPSTNEPAPNELRHNLPIVIPAATFTYRNKTYLPFLIDEYNDPPRDRDFVRLCINYLHDYMLVLDVSQAHDNINRQLQQNPPTVINSILDLLRISHAHRLDPHSPPNTFTLMAMPTATQLIKAGMKIKHSLSEIVYTPGLLKIPKIKINYSSEHLLLNLKLMELSDHQYDSYIINYLYFMDGLINTSEDVDILIENGVIENFLSNSQAVSDLFNKVTLQIPLYAKNYYYNGICDQLRKYSKRPYYKWLAEAKRDKCRSPVVICSSFIAFMLISLALLQTIFAGIALKKEKKLG